MSEILLWVVKATVVALIGAIGAVFLRLRTLEAKRTAADVRLSVLEGKAPADHGAQLDKIGDQLDDLSTRLAKVETKLESRSVDRLWEEHNQLTRELGTLTKAVSKQDGMLQQWGSLVDRLDNYLRTVQGGKS